MAAWVLLAAAFLLQDASPGDRLKREGWKAVEELGAQAALKPELEKLAAGDDAELRWWAGAALAEIEARAKGAAAYIDVRRVTLEAKEKKASEILADLLAVENLRLTGDLTPAEKAVSVAFKGTPFFEAVDGVCREAGCVLRRRTDGDFEVKIDDGRTIRPNTYAGPTSVAVRSLTFRSQADFRGDPAHRLDLGLSFRMDPRAWTSTGRCRWEFVSARDDTGADLDVQNPGSWGWSGNEQPAAVTMKASLAVPGAAARKIASIRGVASLFISRAPREIVFDEVLTATDQTREAGALRITLKKVVLADRKYLAYLEYSPKEAPGAPDMNDLVLEDAAGRRFSGGNASKGEGTLFKTFEPIGVAKTSPARLRVTLVPGLHIRKVYFELKDIPIR